jgi:hypothetical protein
LAKENQLEPQLKATSAMGSISVALMQDHIGPDHKVTDMDRFFTALLQALYDAYVQGWKDCADVKQRAD